ncbi:hypothetical protein GGI43DRAFT_282612 [Trichoderma evansii]
MGLRSRWRRLLAVSHPVGRGRGSFLCVAVSAGTRHIMIISDARELGPSGHINGSCIRHEIARHRASDQPHSGTLSRQTDQHGP